MGFPNPGNTYSSIVYMEIVFSISKLWLGAYFIVSGIDHFRNVKGMTAYADMKGLPLPAASVVLSGIALILGGICIALQEYLTVAYPVLIVFLISAALLMHQYWKLEPGKRMAERINFHKNLALAAALAMLFTMSAS